MDIADFFNAAAERIATQNSHNDEPSSTAVQCQRCRWTFADASQLNADGVCTDCAATLERGYEISSKAGRCRTGSDQAGTIFHARLLDENGSPQWRAVCGTEPGRRSVGWSSYKPADRRVTCQRCQKRLANSRCTGQPDGCP